MKLEEVRIVKEQLDINFLDKIFAYTGVGVGVDFILDFLNDKASVIASLSTAVYFIVKTIITTKNYFKQKAEEQENGSKYKNKINTKS